MIIRIHHKEASEKLNFNNPRQTECSLRIGNQNVPCVLWCAVGSVDKRRDFKHVPICQLRIIIAKNVFVHNTYYSIASYGLAQYLIASYVTTTKHLSLWQTKKNNRNRT